MAIKDWQGAQNAIEQFTQVGGDKKKLERLKVLLDVKQAQAESPNKLADILLEQRFLIRLYLADQLEKLLYKAMQYAWQNNEMARLTQLKDLARTTISDNTKPQQKKFLDLCLKWLEIEAALTTSQITPNTILKFAKLVFVKNGYGIRYTLRQSVKQLIVQWKNDNTLLFAWIYIAAQRVQPPLIHGATIEPLTQLTEQSQQIAAQVEKNLVQLPNIPDIDLDNAKMMLDSEQNVWQNLAKYINILPFTPAQQPVPPDSLDEMNNLLGKIKEIKQHLKELENTDLRKEQAQNKLINVQGFVRDQLLEFSIRQTWLDRVDELKPLASLTFILSQFNKTTGYFGSDVLENLDKRDLLETMRRFLVELIEKFENANLVEHGFWQILSQECWTLACQEGGILNPQMPTKPDLQALCDLLPELDKEEQQFRIALVKLYDEACLTHVPTGAQIDANNERYQTFFCCIPKDPPRTRRGYRLFKREADKGTMATLLKSAQGQSQLPSWVNQFLEKGIP